MGRASKDGDERGPKNFIRKYLEPRRTKTAKELAKKAVIGLWPETILGEIIWTPNKKAHKQPSHL